MLFEEASTGQPPNKHWKSLFINALEEQLIVRKYTSIAFLSTNIGIQLAGLHFAVFARILIALLETSSEGAGRFNNYSIAKVLLGFLNDLP
ncbi:hypothetical protein ACTXT7_016878 [Hymenolepis weldensis]